MSKQSVFLKFVLQKRALILALSLALFSVGVYAFHLLQIDAYPQIAPLTIQAITQWPGRSTLEIEKQITIPVETALSGVPGSESIRSVSLFGLSVVTVKFDHGTDSFHARQSFEQYLLTAALPSSVHPQLSPDSDAIGEVMRYRVEGANTSLMDLTGYNQWDIYKSLKQVSGIANVSNFGGLTKQYYVVVSPEKLLSYGISLNQVITALNNGNSNVGGNILHRGEQQTVVRGVGLLQSLDDIRNIVVAVRGDAPIQIKDVASVDISHLERLGMVQFDNHADIVEGVVMERRGENTPQVLERLRNKITELNSGLLPPQIKIKPFYDRQNLLNITTSTVMENLLIGMGLVSLVLFLFLQSFRAALIVAAIIPLGICASFIGMLAFGIPANLISLGSIDFGVIVDAGVIVMENIIRQLSIGVQNLDGTVISATSEVQRAMLFTTGIIIVSYAPLFFIGGVEGLIFKPMAVTMGIALLASMALSMTFIPGSSSLLFRNVKNISHNPPFITAILNWYRPALKKLLAMPGPVLGTAFLILAVTVFIIRSLGTEFLPTLEENNLWVRITMPNTVSLQYSGDFASKLREYFYSQPGVDHVAVQIGRPDDGTDSTGVFNQEYGIYFKLPSQWPKGENKKEVVHRLENYLSQIPGIQYSFSQYIQDNVQEALSGVKSENTIKLFGNDLATLENKAHTIAELIKHVDGVKDVGIFRELGQPTLNITVDRDKAGHYGLNVNDINTLIENAIGGAPITTILEGERTYNLALRLPATDRNSVKTISHLLIDTPSGHHIPLGMIANVGLNNGPFFIYREGGKRYIAIKFSVRNRDLGSTYHEAKNLVDEKISLPSGYKIVWAGVINEMERAQQKLMIIIPVSLLAIFLLLYIAFNNFKDASIVLLNAPFSVTGGALALFIAREPLSISAGIGFLSLFGIAIQTGVILISYINKLKADDDRPLTETIIEAASLRLRPILMTSLLASIGLLPAALSHAIGSQVQRPLALVIVGGMALSPFIALLILPVIYSVMHREKAVVENQKLIAE